jgi:hypothetical protein
MNPRGERGEEESRTDRLTRWLSGQVSHRSWFAVRAMVCVVAGVVFAVLCSLWVGLVVLVQGTAPFDRAGLSPLVVIGIYFLVGPLGGALIGLMLPLGRSVWGSILVGFVGVLPLYGAFALLLVPRKDWLVGLVLTCFLGMFVGGITGYSAWRRENRSRVT